MKNIITVVDDLHIHKLSSRAQFRELEILGLLEDSHIYVIEDAHFDTELNSSSEDAPQTKVVYESLLTKSDKISVIDIDSPSSLVLTDNTEYRLTNVSSLSIAYPEGDFEVLMRLSTASSEDIVIELPANTKYIGSLPVFGNNQTLEISIKDGIAVCWRVE